MSGVHGRFLAALSATDVKTHRQTSSDEERYGLLERFKTLLEYALTDASTGLSTLLKVYDSGSKLTATTLAPMLQEIVAMIEAQALGIRWKRARLATAAALPACTYANGTLGVGATLTGNANGALTVDGQAAVVGNVVLVKDQVDPAQNGPYAVTVAGSGGAAFVLTRVTDEDQASELVGGLTYTVDEGTDNVDTVWLCTTDGVPVIGTTAISWIPLPGVGGLLAGAGLTKTGVTINVIANGDGSIVVNANDIQIGVLATDGQHGNRGGGGLHANAIAGGAAGFMTGADKTKLDGVEALADVTDEANVRAALAAATLSIGFNGQILGDLGEPTAPSHATTKNYVDSIAQGLRLKANARTATAVALDAYTPAGNTLTMDANGALTIGAVAVDDDDIVLVKDEAGGDAPYNGWYAVTDKGSAGTPGILTRADFASTAAELEEGSFGWVKEGTHANQRWAVLTGPAVINVNDVTFTQLGGALSTEAGAGLSQNGAGLDVNVDGSTLEINADTLRVKASGITDSHVAAANKDGIAGTASMRTLGTGAQQAAAGNAAPNTHAASHAGGGSDAIANAVAAGAAGLMTGADKTKLDNIETAADVTDAANVDAAGAVMHTDVAANTKRVVLMRNADGTTYSSFVFHTAAAPPSDSDNTAAGYANGSFWYDSTAGSEALWFKASESGGSALWDRAATTTLRQSLADNTADIDITGMSFAVANIKAVKLRIEIDRGDAARRVADLVLLFDAATPANSTVTAVGTVNLGDVGVTYALVDAGGGNYKLEMTTSATGTAATLQLRVIDVWA